MPEDPNQVLKTDSQKVEFVKKKFTIAQSSFNQDIERFSRYYRLYRGRPGSLNQRDIGSNYRGLSNLNVPEPYRIVERKTAKIANSIKKIQINPQGPSDVEAAKTGTVLASYLTERLGLEYIYKSWIKESRIIGLSWLKVVWNIDDETKDEPYKGLKITQYPVDRVYFDPAATMLDIFQGKLQWLINEYDADIDTLRKNKNYDKKVLDDLEKRSGENVKESSLSQVRQMFISKQGGEKSGKQRKKQHRIQEFWGVVDGKNRLMVVADSQFLLRDDKNPYEDILDNPIPFVPMPASVNAEESFPIGDIEPLESLFIELNDTRNQRMDTVTLNIDPPKEILRSAQIDEADLVPRRGWTYKSNVPNGVRWIAPDMQGVAAAIQEEQFIRADIQQTAGVLDFAQGSEVQAGLGIDTAKGVLTAKSEADSFTENEIDIAMQAIQHLWRIIMAYSQEFLDRKFTVRVTENGTEAFHEVSKNAIKGNIDIDVEVETLQDKTTRQQMFLTLFNLAKDVPGANMGKFFTDLLENFREDVNIEEYYQAPPPAPPTPPSVSIRLDSEDLTDLGVDQIAKMVPGVDQEMFDPVLRKMGRDMMAGEEPTGAEEEKDRASARKDKADADLKTSETVKNLTEDNDES